MLVVTKIHEKSKIYFEISWKFFYLIKFDLKAIFIKTKKRISTSFLKKFLEILVEKVLIFLLLLILLNNFQKFSGVNVAEPSLLIIIMFISALRFLFEFVLAL